MQIEKYLNKYLDSVEIRLIFVITKTVKMSNLTVQQHEAAIEELRKQKNQIMLQAVQTCTQRDPKYRAKQGRINKAIRFHMDAIENLSK